MKCEAGVREARGAVIKRTIQLQVKRRESPPRFMRPDGRASAAESVKQDLLEFGVAWAALLVPGRELAGCLSAGLAI